MGESLVLDQLDASVQPELLAHRSMCGTIDEAFDRIADSYPHLRLEVEGVAPPFEVRIADLNRSIGRVLAAMSLPLSRWADWKDFHRSGTTNAAWMTRAVPWLQQNIGPELLHRLDRDLPLLEPEAEVVLFAEAARTLVDFLRRMPAHDRKAALGRIALLEHNGIEVRLTRDYHGNRGIAIESLHDPLPRAS